MPVYWYYRRGGREFGPIAEDELWRLAEQGEISPTDHLWRDGTPHWVAAHTVKGLFPAPPPFDADSVRSGKSGQASRFARAAGRDALQAVRLLIADPVGGLVQAYEHLGPDRAEQAGIAFLALYALGVAVDAFSLSRRMLAMVGEPLNRSFQVHYQGPLGLGILAGLVPPFSALAACWLTRRWMQHAGTWRSDLFLVGAAFFPLGVSNILYGLFGVDRFNVITAIGVVAEAWKILVLFVGLTKVFGVSERAAAYIIAGILVGSLWGGQMLLWIFPGQ